MSKILVVLSLLFSVSAFAKDMKSDKSDGCGLGWNVMADKTLLGTTVRGTTNYVIPPAFGMTTGTINCKQHSIVKAEKQRMHYTENNFDSILAEMAQGNGEFLETYAMLFGCQSDDFASFTQSHYTNIVAGEVNPSNVLGNLQGELKDSGLNCVLL